MKKEGLLNMRQGSNEALESKLVHEGSRIKGNNN